MAGLRAVVQNGLIGGLAVLVILSQAQMASSQQAPVRGIERIAGDVYRFRDNYHYSVFMVTSDGVIVTDPINADAARWLKGEIARRFAKPVKYLIYSHDHADHIAGGEVFADTATVVAHDNARAHIIGEGRPTAAPDITFSDRLTLTLGGKVVELIHLGPNHSDNMIVMRFPAERILFAVDIVARNSLPYRNFPNVHIDGLIAALMRVEAMDFDILAPGHGSLGSRADVAPHRRYIETLRARVLTHMRAGKTVDEIKSLVTMAEYKGWGSYGAWRALNVEGMVRHLGLYRRPN
jgi:glyoxylase-like metal-dependent hydrolase (beta-lactamase superfamily II)